ncbi:hypothetical protein PMAYCL1PPCAC_25873, partial [Pristionchus mayeri]
REHASETRIILLQIGKPDGIIRWEIDNVLTLTKRYSPSTEIYGVPWKLDMRAEWFPPFASKFYTLYIYGNYKSNSPLWECCFAFQIVIRNID